MSCGSAGSNKSKYTGNQVGDFNYVGDLNYVAGGPPGSGLSAGTTVLQFIPNASSNRRPWLRQDAILDDKLLDACWPTIELNWFVEIQLTPETLFRVSDKSFYVQDEDGLNRFVDARAEKAPQISVTIGEWLNPNYEISDAAFSLNNRDGYFNPWLPSGDDYRQWSGAKVTIFVGFGEKRSNYFILFEGQVTSKQGLSTTRDSLEIKAYDKLDLDEIPMPPRVFSADNFPDIDESFAGKPIPIVYGDWTEEVPDAGSVNAVCLNGLESSPDSYLFKVSEIELESITAIYLHRGNRKESEPGGPVAFDLGTISFDLTSGQFSVPTGIDVLLEEVSDANNLPTQEYQFLKGDKITVKCKGKPLHIISVDRLADISQDITLPTGISVGFDYTFWVSDDATQKIYQIEFGTKNIVRELAYADIEASITGVSAISIASDNFLWVAVPAQSKIYRYSLDANATGLIVDTTTTVGLLSTLANIQGVAVQSDNKIWIVDQASGNFYKIDAFSAAQPFVVTSFNKSAFDASATDILDLAVDEQNDQLVVADRNNNKYYRIARTGGTLGSSTVFTVLADNVEYVTGASLGQDGSLFFLDQATLTIYNYNEQADASTNPAFIARDLLQKYASHTYDEFDLSWNATAAQLSVFKCRVVMDKKTNLVTYVNKLLAQYNTAFHFRLGRFALFWITFDNFTTEGKLVGEKDIQVDSFKPSKEMNQYFNSVNSTYSLRPYDSSSKTSDTYVSPAAIAFAGKEVSRTIDLPNVYRRADLDRLMPLYVRLSAPEPEFLDVTFGFRLIRTQMQSFMVVQFDGDVDCETGVKSSGRRYNHVPCMVRKMTYDLGPMTIAMKLWSLGSTTFGDFVPPGTSVGGENDQIVLSNLGRAGRISPIGIITAAGSEDNSLILEDFGAFDAETRTNQAFGLSWAPGYKVDIVDGATKAILQTVTIDSVSGGEVFFLEDIAVSLTPTTRNAADFITGGHYLQYTRYDASTVDQNKTFGSFCRPTMNYPTSKTQETEEQRGGAHSFDDGGIPYVLYPIGFTSY